MKKGIDTTLTKKLDMDGVELSGGEYSKNGNGKDTLQRRWYLYFRRTDICSGSACGRRDI